MTFRPTNVYRELGEDFAYSIHTQLDALTLRRALAIEDEAEEAAACATWTVVLPLGPEFQPADVAVRLDSAGVLWVAAEAASRWQAGDFVRLVRRLPLPSDRVDIGSARCWIEEDRLMLRADRLAAPAAAATATTAAAGKKSPAVSAAPATPTLTTAAWPKCSLASAQQRHGCLAKDKSAKAAGGRWSLELALPEFDSDQVSVTRSADNPARLVVTAHHEAEATAADDSGVASTVRHEYRREIAPPAGVQLDQVVSRLCANGVLRLEAPAVAGAKARGLRLGGGAGGGSGGPAGKIASLTRELRHHGGAHHFSPASASASVSPSTERTGRNCVVQ